MAEGFSVVIPAFNEEKAIGQSLDGLKKAMNASGAKYEIIVVDDGSTDGTNAIAAAMGVKLIKNQSNLGYGASLKCGIRHSAFDRILIMDADGSYPVEGIGELLRLSGEYDMVVGARTGEKVSIPSIRKPAKWLLNKLANYLSGVKIPDLNSGLRVMDKKVTEEYIYLLPDGFSFTTTITLIFLSKNYSVKYVPINYLKRKGKSKIRPFSDTLNFTSLIVRTILYFNPLKIFLPLSLILFTLSLAVFIYSYFFTEKVLDATVMILFVGSIQVLAIGMLADLIDRKGNR